MLSRKKILSILLIIISVSLFSGEAAYDIKNLNAGDPVYEKFKNDIKKNFQLWEKLKKNYELTQLKDIKKLSIAIYRVKSGETIFSIAEKLDLVVDTLISFNALVSDIALKEGDEILVPNMDGIVLFPKKETRILDISKLYQVPKSFLMYINGFHRDFIYSKEEVFVPFARMTEEEKNYFLAKPFIFPIKNIRFTSNYGLRIDPFTQKWKFHGGFDFGTPIGTKIYASAPGEVIFSGWGEDYGKLIVLKHKYGYTTWYGHLQKLLVKNKSYVHQGELIALSGNTGRSTGPHLHFEMRRFNLRKNPLEVLDFSHSLTQ
jgi:murein DD-endopeptidase MepM/ murein hydrolase activator NlpD